MSTRVLIVQPTLAGYRVPLFRELSRRPEIDLTLIYASTPHRPNAQPDGFHGIYEPMRIRHVRGHPVYWQGAQLRCATRRHADVLILNWDVHYASLWPALLRARMNHLPTILWGHGYSRHDASPRGRPRRALARLATALLFYNETGARKYRELGIDPRRIFVAPNSLDQEPIQRARQRWLQDPARLEQFRRDNDLVHRPILLFVSRLDPQRRLDVLLNASAKLLPTHPRLAVVLIGKGSEEAPLRELARTLHIEPHVRFQGPIYDEDQLAPWFLTASAFAYPSFMGLSLLHAFGYGLPVITGDRREEHGPEIESLREGENGLMFQAGDAVAMAAAVDRLLSDPPLREKLSRGARAAVTEQFTLPQMVAGFEAAIDFCRRNAR